MNVRLYACVQNLYKRRCGISKLLKRKVGSPAWIRTTCELDKILLSIANCLSATEATLVDSQNLDP
jgi:hypothetical protein